MVISAARPIKFMEARKSFHMMLQQTNRKFDLSKRGLFATEDAVAIEPPMALSEDAEMSFAEKK